MVVIFSPSPQIDKTIYKSISFTGGARSPNLPRLFLKFKQSLATIGVAIS